MADPRHSRLTAEMFVEMLHNEEDPAILSPNSESEISDAADLDYMPQGQSGVVGVNPALLDEDDSVIILKTCLFCLFYLYLSIFFFAQ